MRGGSLRCSIFAVRDLCGAGSGGYDSPLRRHKLLVVNDFGRTALRWLANQEEVHHAES